MANTQKQTAHQKIKTSAQDLMLGIIALAEAESGADAESETDHATSLRIALVASGMSGQLPDFEPLDLLWLVRSLLGGSEFDWLSEPLRQAMLTDLDGVASALKTGAPLPPPIGALAYLAATRPVPRPRPTCHPCSVRSVRDLRRSCGSCASCCHRAHCNPHVCH